MSCHYIKNIKQQESPQDMRNADGSIPLLDTSHPIDEFCKLVASVNVNAIRRKGLAL